MIDGDTVARIATDEPLAFFAYKRYSRFRVMDQQLPGILDVMTRAVRAGQSIDGAFKLAGESGQQPTAGEFAQVDWAQFKTIRQ